MKVNSRQRALHRIPGNPLNLRGVPGTLCLYEDLSRPRTQGIYPRFDPPYLVFGYLLDRIAEFPAETPLLDVFVSLYEDNPLDGIPIFEFFETFFEERISAVTAGTFLSRLAKKKEDVIFDSFVNFSIALITRGKYLHVSELVIINSINAFLSDFIYETYRQTLLR